MPTRVICLGCGGEVVEPGTPLPSDGGGCACPPTATELEAREVKCPSCGGALRVGVRACPYCACTLATRRCGHCAAWNLADARHCQRCGREEVLGGVGAGRASEGPCPRCDGKLAARSYAEMDVDECDACGGVFIEGSMMDRIVAARCSAAHGLHLALPERRRDAESEVRYVECPACRKLMNRQVFGRISGVVVDVCKQHGVWFDAGELSDALEFVARGGMGRSRQREQDALAEQLRAAARSAPLTASSAPSRVERSVGASFLRDLLADLWSR